MKTQMTKESVLAAVKAGAKSLTAVAHAHGYKGSVSSGTARTIRTLVPSVVDLMAGQVPKAQAVKVQKPVEKAVVQHVVLQRKRAYGGHVYGPVFAEAVGAGKVRISEFVAATSAKLGLTEQSVKFATQVMCNPRHKTNGNRSRDVATEYGVMQLETCLAAAG